MFVYTDPNGKEHHHEDWKALGALKHREFAGKGDGPRPVHTAAQRDPSPAPQPVGTVQMTGEAGQVSEAAQKRVMEDEKELRRLGFQPAPTVYAPGSRVNAIGVRNFSIERKKLEESPLVEEGLSSIIDSVQRERREDVRVKLGDLHLHTDGRLTRGAGHMHMEQQGFLQLLRLAEAFYSAPLDGGSRRSSASSWLAAQDPETRKWNWDKQRRTGAIPPQKEIVLRTRVVNDRRQVFAVVSTDYSAQDADQVAAAILPGFVGSEMRGITTYDPLTTNLYVEASLMPDRVVDLAAGDVFKVSTVLKTNDSGQGGIRLVSSYLRNLCLNLIILDKGEQVLFSRAHRGDLSNIAPMLRAGIKKADAMWDHFRDRWKILRKENAVSALQRIGIRPPKNRPVTETKHIFDVLADNITVPGIRRDAMVEMLLSSFDKEPGDSLADVVNAVTRLHQRELIPVVHREDIESQAGEFVMSWSDDLGYS
jgi:hypothetical protein